ncbi:hypothetical protein EDB89DRAFT_387572 [Lactarius sanguifluus]|nr:hypothetical protein EDB89DRAFT_2027617 [Lactarius sanguifluus]KAH9164808.1 hypothetical protein EDB89DRAFT_387572 [Lactarius sanguifluus]
MLALSFLRLLLLATAGLAAPSRRATTSSVPASVLAQLLPQGQQQLVAPTDAPSFVTLGVGNQNYTCSSSGNYTSTGAVVQVFDVAPLFPGSEFSKIEEDAFAAWTADPCDNPYEQNLAQDFQAKFNVSVSGQHYFIANPDGSLAPVWDFRADGPTKGNPGAIVVAAEAGDIPSPTGPPNVDWVELTNVSGKLASTVFRVNTVAGDPPSSCQPGSPDIQVKFTCKYFLYGSQV